MKALLADVLAECRKEGPLFDRETSCAILWKQDQLRALSAREDPHALVQQGELSIEAHGLAKEAGLRIAQTIVIQSNRCANTDAEKHARLNELGMVIAKYVETGVDPSSLRLPFAFV